VIARLRTLALIWVVIAAALSAVAQPLSAQTATAPATTTASATTPKPADALPDYKMWATVATRAEDSISTGRASTVALEQLRAQLADWRARFFAAKGTNAARIKTLLEQIAALGAPPADGATEPKEIADRRAALDTQLATLKAPALAADEAYRRADGMVSEIDSLIRDRQASALMQLGPTPLNPINWATGIAALSGSLRAVLAESIAAWQNPVFASGLRLNLVPVVLYLVAAAVLLLRGRRWMDQLMQLLARSTSKRGVGVYAALLSLGQIILPYAGLLALVQALSLSGIIGIRGERLSTLLPQAGLIVLSGLWLGSRVFPRAGARAPIFTLSAERAAEARLVIGGLALVVALNRILTVIAGFDSYPAEASVTLGFPLLVAAAVLLFRIGRLLALHLRGTDGEQDTRRYRNQLVRLVSRAVMALSLIAPLLAAVGYFHAAVFFTYPAISSLALLALLLLIQRFVADLYGLVTGKADNAGDALVPVLMAFILSLLALPVLALIWGARVSDLTELWTRFTEGFQIGSSRISPSNFMVFAIVFAVGYMGTRLFQGSLRVSILPRTKIDTGGQNAIVSGVGYIGVILAAIIAITSAGIDLSSLAIVAGALSVGIGFGLQNIVSNFVSGIILLIERPVREGDWIEVGGIMGTVRHISVRSTRVETFDRTDVIVPNSDLITNMVTNWTRSNVTGRIILKVGVAYGSDTRRVQALLGEIAQAHPIVIINPPPNVTFMAFGADSLNFEVRCVLSDINFGLTVRSELNHEIARRFAEEGIEIPFAQRDIWLRNPEVLRGGGATAPVSPPPPSPPPPPAPAPTAPPVTRDDPESDADR